MFIDLHCLHFLLIILGIYVNCFELLYGLKNFNNFLQNNEIINLSHHTPIYNKNLKHSKRLKRSSHLPDNNRILELYITNDYSQFLAYNKSIENVIKRTKEIIYYVNSYFRPLNISIVLVGIEIWQDGDKLNSTNNAEDLMRAYLIYRQSVINMKIRNDNAQLITREPFTEGIVGKAPVLSLCSWRHSGGVNMDNGRSASHIATTLAHELGHNFGLFHDNDSTDCPQEKCIMSSSSGSQKSPSQWSKYSLQQFNDAFKRGMDYCLWDSPASYLSPINSDQCGNYIIEDGEECDCGPIQECKNKCCLALNCTLSRNSTCAYGECCDLATCKFKEATTICRHLSDPCDLAEYCDGQSAICPNNVYLQNGIECTSFETKSHCFNGKCRSRTSQCKLLWGATANDSHPGCYNRFNVLGSANGHCGFSWTLGQTFIKCNRSDVQCGMLHCEHDSAGLEFWRESLAYTLPHAWIEFPEGVRNHCKGVVLDVGETKPDPGMVPDGCECGLGFMCIDQKCRDVAIYLQQCPDCHGHGVCNSLNQCHCDKGYQPPTCQYPGVGGSLHSGPINTIHNNILFTFIISIVFTFLFPLTVYVIYKFVTKKLGYHSSNLISDPIADNLNNELIQHQLGQNTNAQGQNFSQGRDKVISMNKKQNLSFNDGNAHIYANLPPKRPIYTPKGKGKNEPENLVEEMELVPSRLAPPIPHIIK